MDKRKTQQSILPGLRGAAIFYAVTFALSWSVWGIIILLPQAADWAPLIIIGGAYSPLVASLLLNRVVGGKGAGRRWLRNVLTLRRQWQWVLLGGLVLPIGIVFGHLVIYRLFVGAITLSSNPPWYWAASTAPFYVLSIWLSSAVEEFGWQGFALPRLTQRLPPLAACLIHGVLWGMWHLPLYLTGAWSGDYQSVGLLFGITLTLAPTMFWLTKRAKGSVIPAVLFHGATNHYSALFTKELLEHPIFTEPLRGYFIEIKICLYLAIALFLILMTRGRLGDQAISATDLESLPDPAIEPSRA